MPAHPSLAHNTTSAALNRTSLHLQQHLQTLLDAQSEGLLSGLGQPADDDTSSVSSAAPPSKSPHIKPVVGPRVTPVRQPPKKRIGLNSARHGISTTMAKLADVKAQESALIGEEIEERVLALHVIDNFSSKKSGLEAQIKHIHSSPTSQTIGSLRTQEKALDTEIQELEARLWEMKAQQRQLLAKIDELDNSLQSKLSSYTAALALVDKESKTFITEPGIHPLTHSKAEGFWTLPPKRRTLQIAHSQWREEQQSLLQQQRDIHREQIALEEGKVVWDAVVAEVKGVEEVLQAEMQMSGAEAGMRKVLGYMDKGIESMEGKLRVVEERGWKLLVCAVGAEVEACVEGRELLRGALEIVGGGDGGVDVGDRGREEGMEMRGWMGDEVAERALVEKSEDEDDGPGMDLLLEHLDDQRDGNG